MRFFQSTLAIAALALAPLATAQEITRHGEGNLFFTAITIPPGAETLYLSGTGARQQEDGSWGDIRQQAVDTFSRFQDSLEELGWSMSDVVQVRVFAVADENGEVDFAAFNEGYLEFFGIVSATPMLTWEGGTRRIYEKLTEGFRDKIYLERRVSKVRRHISSVVVEDEAGNTEAFDDVVFACNANQALMAIDKPTFLEAWLLSKIRYESELHNHAIVHYDDSVLPKNEAQPLDTRSNHIEQYGARPDNYEITYIMHNQQPWAKGSDKPCLVTYNPISKIDESKIVKRWWFQHVVHDVRHIAFAVHVFRLIQGGKRRTWHCGAHTLMNSQEHGFISGLVTARQLGADYPFDDDEARKWFNFFGRMMYGWRMRKA